MIKYAETTQFHDSDRVPFSYSMNKSMKAGILSSIMALIALFTVTTCSKGDAENITPNPKPPAEAGRNFKVIHVYVALCDNESQGIAPVPAKIGDGDDPANNLYWGCSEGARPYFSKSKLWKRLSAGKVSKPCDQGWRQGLSEQHRRRRGFSDFYRPQWLNGIPCPHPNSKSAPQTKSGRCCNLLQKQTILRQQSYQS